MVVDLHVAAHGTGPPVVLVPGLGYASWYWHPQDELADRYRLIKVDPRGAGQSPKPSDPYSIAEMASDIAAVIEAAGQPAHVVGHSMGGYLAQTLALEKPGLLRTLTLVSTTCGGPRHEPVPSETMDAWQSEAHRPPEEYARATMHLSLRPGWSTEHPTEYEELLERRLAHPTPPESWQRQFSACVRFLADGIDAAAIPLPTLVVHGDADRVVPVGNGRALAAMIPRAQLRVFTGAGHLVSLEEAAGFNRSVASFWEEASRA